MRVDFTSFAAEPPDSGKSGRSGQTDTAGRSGADAIENSASSNSASSTSIGTSIGTVIGASSSSDSSTVDQTRFSFDRARVQSLEAQVLAQPEVRATKVQALQSSIESGDYSVPPSQVAEAMVSEIGG